MPAHFHSGGLEFAYFGEDLCEPVGVFEKISSPNHNFWVELRRFKVTTRHIWQPSRENLRFWLTHSLDVQHEFTQNCMIISWQVF
jgi:hypothetical protein